MSWTILENGIASTGFTVTIERSHPLAPAYMRGGAETLIASPGRSSMKQSISLTGLAVAG